VSRIRWRAVAACLGVPRRAIAKEARFTRRAHKRFGNAMSKYQWDLRQLRWWSTDYGVEVES
jgi:hypothetical protein